MRTWQLWMVAGAASLAWALTVPTASLRADEVVRGKSIGAWLQVLRDRHSAERDLAIQALSEVGAKDPRVVPALAAAAASDPDVAFFAISELGRLGPNARQAAPTLSAILWQRPDGRRRIAAADALWQISKQPACIDALIQSLDDRVRDNRLAAAAALGRIGRPAKKATPKLLRLLGDHASVRVCCVEALGRIQSDPQTTVPELIKALHDPLIAVRTNAAEALARFGGEAASAIPALERATEDEDSNVRVEAAYALWCIGKREDALVVLYSALAKSDFDAEDAAGMALGHLAEIGRDNDDVAPRLMKLLNQGHRDQVGIAMVLWSLNRRHEALAALSAALEDERFYIRRAAAVSLEKLGLEAKSAAPALLKALARTPDQEQLLPESAPEDPPSIVPRNTLSVFESFRLAAWKALQTIDPAAASRFRSQPPGR